MLARITAWLPEDDVVVIYAQLQDCDVQVHKQYDTASLQVRQELNSLVNEYAPLSYPLVAKLNALVGKDVNVFHFDKVTRAATNLSPILCR